eukprot:6202791-Pleurochrysis_carterae.AAC.5
MLLARRTQKGHTLPNRAAPIGSNPTKVFRQVPEPRCIVSCTADKRACRAIRYSYLKCHLNDSHGARPFRCTARAALAKRSDRSGDQPSSSHAQPFPYLLRGSLRESILKLK